MAEVPVDETNQRREPDEERITIAFMTECALPEGLKDVRQITYLDATNSLLLLGADGTIVLLDACLENNVPLAKIQIDGIAAVVYDKQSSTLLFADRQKLCFRREYGGTFLLKNVLKPVVEGVVPVEMPVEEAVKLVQLSTSEEAHLANRPVLSNFINSLRSAVRVSPTTSQETVVVEVKGMELLLELRTTEPVGDGPCDVPVEWSSPMWPLVSAVAERIRLLLNPDHPYNFDFATESEGIEKEVMVSEAARRLTFDHWPHMDYRWALPCQMSEAGFYHQPNQAGDDRVLCFACRVCLVCWEPADEPWSEHERHSPTCQFIRNSANPNVPFALTMGSLGAFAHNLTMSAHSSLVIGSSSNSEWLAAASETSPTVHLYRTDRVVQAKQSFKVDVFDSFIALKTGYISAELPRRPQRVTWSDDTIDLPTDAAADADKKNPAEDRTRTSGSPPSVTLNSTQETGSRNSAALGKHEVIITALCTVGRPCLVEQAAIGAVAGTSPARCHPTVVVGFALDESKISRNERQTESSAEVNALNSVNSVCGSAKTPRIVADASEDEEESQGRAISYHPFIVVYQINESGKPATESTVVANRSEDKAPWTVAADKWVECAPPDKAISLANVDAIDLFEAQHSLLESNFADALMLMESEMDIPEWNGSDSVYCNANEDSASADESDVWSEISKGTPKFDEKSPAEFMPINCDPPLANIVLVQCFRLPAELDESDLKIKAIIPAQNGLTLVAVVSRDRSTTPNAIQSAIVVYRLNFNEFVTSIQEHPIKVYLDRQHRVEQLLLLSADLFVSSRGNSESGSSVDILETAVIRTSEGEVWLIDLNNNERLKLCEEKAAHIAVSDSGRCTILTHDGKLLLLQVELASTQKASEEEDEDATVAALLATASLSRTSNTSCDKDVLSALSASSESKKESAEESEDEPLSSSSLRSNQFFLVSALQPLTTPNLRRMWELTRSEGNAGLTPPPCNVVGLTALYASCSGFQIIPPPGWNEIQLHQKFRKNPQHCLRTDRLTRSWHQLPDGRSSAHAQAFEMTFQQNHFLSHLNIRFSLHRKCLGCPDVEVTILRRRAVSNLPQAQGDASRCQTSRLVPNSGTRPAVLKVDVNELKAQCDTVAGPFRLADFLEVSGMSALIQLAGVIFLPGSRGTAGGKGNKMQPFYLVLESLTDLSVEQLISMQKIRGKERALAGDAGGKSRSSRKRETSSASDTSRAPEKGARKSSSYTKGSDLPPSSGSARTVPYPSASWITVGQATVLSNTSRKGIEWIEEISITPLRAKRCPQVPERLERRMMIETRGFHVDLVHIAAGVKISDVPPPRTNGERLLRQHKALDILIWLLDNWAVSSNKEYVLGLTDQICLNMDALMTHGFMRSQRSISHKWCSLLISLMRFLKTMDVDKYAMLLTTVLIALKESVEHLFIMKSAGSLHWFITLAFFSLQMGVTLAGYEICTKAVNTFLIRCSNTLTAIGFAWKRSRSENVYEKLANDYGLCGLPLELVMYDWPAPVLSLWPRSCFPGSGCLVPVPAASTSGPNQTAASSGTGSTWSLKHFSPKQGSAGIPVGNAKASPASSQKEVTAVSAFINGLTAQDEMDWLEMFSVSMHEESELFQNNRSDGTGFGVGYRFGAGAFDSNANRECKRRVLLSPSHLSGLLEVEPLTFTCTAASEYIKVENLDTGEITLINSSATQLGHVTSNGPFPIKPKQSSTSPSSSSQQPQSTDSYNFKTDLQNLSAKMKDIAMEQARIKEQSASATGAQTLSSIPVNCVDSGAQGSTTQGSSASTFGVPTTPKTTPFMTPTPLSPSHLSPINSEGNLAALVEENLVIEEKTCSLPSVENQLLSDRGLPKSEISEASNASEGHCNSHVLPPAVAVVPSDLLKPPPLQVLSIERMASGMRKFVVLDFGVPVLLTDVLIPSCAELASLFVDVWLLGEGVDGQRLTGSTQIGQKSIVLQDIAPTMLIRFLKLTYVGRQVLNAPCRIPIGFFFGHRFFSNWQTYACPVKFSQISSCVPPNPRNQQTQAISLVHLRQLCEDLRCRHQLASTELQHLVKENAPERDVKQVYKECAQLRAQWNIVRGVVHRLESDHFAPLENETQAEGSWLECCPDQLRVLAESLFSLLIQSSHLLRARAVAVDTTLHTADALSLQGSFDKEADMRMVRKAESTSPTFQQISGHQLLTLSDAVRHFALFCTLPMPKLQVECATWLLHHGSEALWWPFFFPRVLHEFFVSPHKKGDQKVFLLLSFLCCHSIKSSSEQSSIILELLKLINDILQEALGDNEVSNSNSQGVKPWRRLDATLLCWSLMLTSSAFDVIIGNRRKMDRWSFLAGEYAQPAYSQSGEKVGEWLPKGRKNVGFGTSASSPSLMSSKKNNDSSGIQSANLMSSLSTTTSSKNAKSQLESLWEQHLKVLETMKASMKMSESVTAKLQKKIDLKKKQALGMSTTGGEGSSDPVGTQASSTSGSAVPVMKHSLPPSAKSEQGATENSASEAVLNCEIKDMSAEDLSNQDLASLHSEELIDHEEITRTLEDALKSKIPMPSSNSVPSITSDWELSLPLKRRGNKQRQYNVRLKLPLKLCLSTATRLIRLLCEFNNQLPTAGKLIACKVVARICSCASHHTIPLICALGDCLEKLLEIGVSGNTAPQLRHAVLCLFLDAIEAESRTIAKTAPSARNSEESFQSNQSSNYVETLLKKDIAEYDNICMKITGIKFSVLLEEVRARNEIAEDLPGYPSTGATALASLLPEPFANCKTADTFSIANYDIIPKSSDELEAAISEAVALVDPVEIPECPVDIQTRIKNLHQRCKTVVKRRALKAPGEFCHIFRWIDAVRAAEADHAHSSASTTAYLKRCSADLFYATDLPVDTNLPMSQSALIACLRNECRLRESMKGEEAKRETVAGSGGSSSPSAPGSPTARDDDTNFEQLVLQEVTEELGAEELAALKALNKYAKSITDDITKDAESFFIPCEEALHNNAKASTTAANSQQKNSVSETCARKPILGQVKEESETTPRFVTLREKFSKQVLLDHVMINFLIEMRSASEDVMVQPCTLAVDERLECQLGFRTHAGCLATDLLADALSRYSVRHLAPWRRCGSSRTRMPEDPEMYRQMGRTREVILTALLARIKSISANSPGEHVLRLLDFYSDFQAGVAASLKRLPAEVSWIFPAEGVDALLTFAITSTEMNEQLWTQILRTLDKAVLSDESVVVFIESTPKTALFLKSFISQSISQFSETTTVGPAMVDALGSLVAHIQNSPWVKLPMTILDILRDCFKHGIVSNSSFPIDVMMELFMHVRASPATWRNRQVKHSRLAEFAASAIRFARDYFQLHPFARHSPAIAAERALRTDDICFQQLSKPADLSETADTSAAIIKDCPSITEPLAADIAKTVCYSTVDFDVGATSRESVVPRYRRQEAFVQMLLEEVFKFCVGFKEVVSDLLTEYPTAIENLFDLLSVCTAANRDLDSPEKWVPVSSADFALTILSEISNEAGENSRKLLEIMIRVISQSTSGNSLSSYSVLSKPVAYIIVRILSNSSHCKEFTTLGGHLLVANELERCIAASTGDSTAPVFAPLLRQLASLSSQVASPDSITAPKRPSDIKVDGLYNYAPICTIGSSSMMAHQLSSLLAATPPHRRARTANWSYHFYHNEEWLDLTLTLPYQIILHEVNIRPHVPTLNTGPSAVQIELCSDASLQTWTVLGPPVNTMGFSKIRIPTLSYEHPVHALRIHLRRPPDSTNLGLSQILLLGTNSAHALAAPSFGTDFIHWLVILDKLCLLDDLSIWEYAPKLPLALTTLLMGRPLHADVYSRVAALLAHIDDAHSKPFTTVELIMGYIEEGGNVMSESLEWVADTLFSRCAAPILCGDAPVHVKHGMCVLRQRQLLAGISSLLSSNVFSRPIRQQATAVLLWTASCAIWSNLCEENLRCDTVAACVDVAPEIIWMLCELAGNEIGAYSNLLSNAAAWLLCSLIRAVPRFLHNALIALDVIDAESNPRTDKMCTSSMSVVGRMCQSATAVQQLISLGLLQHWISLIISYCEENLRNTKAYEFAHMEELVSLVRCISSLCYVDTVVHYLDTDPGSQIFFPLISFAVVSVKTASHVASKWPLDLENATIELLCRCVSAGGGHRERISLNLCELLHSGLSGAVQQMVLRCVLGDESVTVKLIDNVTHSRALSFDIKNRMMHPVFGCSRRERVLTVSLYTSLDHLLSASTTSHLKAAKTKSASSSVIPASASSDVVTSLITSMGETTSKSELPLVAEGTDSVVVLICDEYSRSVPMSGAWRVGHFIDVLRSTGRFNNRSTDRRCLLDYIANVIQEPAENFSHAEDPSDGYFTLSLKVVSTTLTELLHSVESGMPVTDAKTFCPPRVSTLQHFARVGGLAVLAQNLQLYQPSAASTATLNPAPPSWPKEHSAWAWVPNLMMSGPAFLENNTISCPFYIGPSDILSAMEEAPPASATNFPFTGPPQLNEEPSGVYEQDYEFIDMSFSQNAAELIQKNLVSYTTGNIPIGAHPAGSTTIGEKAAYKTDCRRPRVAPVSYSLSTGLSPHVVIAFSVLLRLDNYAELLVTHDRRRAKRLLRLAMGVSTSERGLTSPLPPPAPRSANASTDSGNASASTPTHENDTLALLPFVVLERLYRTHPPNSDIGRTIREKSVQHGVLDILLVCLAHYSHQQHKTDPMRPKELLPTPEAVVLTEHLLRASRLADSAKSESTNSANGSAYEDRMPYGVTNSGAQSQQQNFWAKGTGFGSGTTQPQWNVDLHVMKRRLDEETVTYLLQVLASFIFPGGMHFHRSRRSLRSTDTRSSETASSPVANTPPISGVENPDVVLSEACVDCELSIPVVELLARSCLLPTICAYLRNDSVLDISRHVEVYEAVVHLVSALALCPAALDAEGRDPLTVLLSQCDGGISLLTMLRKLHECISVYLSKLSTDSRGVPSEESIPKCTEEGLIRLAPLITRTCTVLCRRVGEDSTKTEGSKKVIGTAEEMYIEAMKPLQFETIPFFAEGAEIPYHYKNSLTAVGSASAMGKRIRRLAQEVVTLSNSLPLTASSSVFVRASEERLDVMKVLITGPSDTPYMNGCFEFDVWFPMDYPNTPMHVNLETTGDQTVRFNPNLYNDGKVCLSVLNTWHGRPEERWNPETSSLLQVIVSVQSLILVSEPYFNEPGYERSKCTQAGQQASRDYDANIRQATVKWAMLEMIRHPPVAFANVIKKHFWLKRYEIMSQVTNWIKEMEAQLDEQRGGSRNLQAHVASLRRHAAALQEEFLRMECPEGLEDEADKEKCSGVQENAQKEMQNSGSQVKPTPRPPMRVLKL